MASSTEPPAAASKDAVQRRSDLRSILICVLLLLAAAVAINPTLEMGIVDDFGYSFSARQFAATGHIAYNATGAMMLVPQILWAAVFIKLFGFSFWITRLSTVVITVFLIPVIYYLGRASGLKPAFAALATLVTVLSPLTLPETFSFMSDVPAFFFFALCLLAAVKAWNAETVRAFALWAIVTAAAGLLGGLDRQVYFAAPLAFLPVVAWVHRRNKADVIWAAGSWTLTLALAIAALRWFRQQPYVIVEDWFGSLTRMSPVAFSDRAGILGTKTLMTAVLALVPVLAGFIAPGIRGSSRKTAILLLASLPFVAIAFAHWPGLRGRWMASVLDGMAMISHADYFPERLDPFPGAAVGLGFYISGAGCFLVVRRWLKSRGSNRLPRITPIPVAVLGLLFTAGWLPLVLVRGYVFTRYLIFLLPIAAIPLLWIYQLYVRPAVNQLSWLVLAGVSLYGVAHVHDTFARGRATVEAVNVLERAGIPHNQITSIYPHDGWIQLEATGYLNNPSITHPPGAYRKLSCPGRTPLTPDLHPRYSVSWSRLSGLTEWSGNSGSYATWFPPGHHQVFIYVNDSYQDCIN